MKVNHKSYKAKESYYWCSDILAAIGSNNMTLEHKPLAVENLKKKVSLAFLNSSNANNN